MPGVSGTPSTEIAVKNGEKIAFLGDSITAGGWGNPAGYVRLVIAGLEANGIKVEPVPAGIGGHKSDQMLARLDKDVLSKKPQWMTLSCGVNDVWHGPRGVPLDDAAAKSGTFDDKVATRGTYKKNITAIIDRAKAAGVKPVRSKLGARCTQVPSSSGPRHSARASSPSARGISRAPKRRRKSPRNCSRKSR